VVRIVVRRLLWSLPTLLFVSVLIYVLVALAPGDPAAQIAGETASPEQIQLVRERLGLDDSLVVRYGRWLGNAVQGDLSTSLRTDEPVTRIVLRALPPTLSLMALTMFVSVVVGGLVGIRAAARPQGMWDRSLSVGSALATSTPAFVVALVLVSELALKRHVLPGIGYTPLTDDPWEWLRHLLLPVAALSLFATAEFGRQMRTSMRQVLDRDFILTAYAKGLYRRRIIFRHALKNAGIPVLTVLGNRFAALFGATIVVESIFIIRGMGYMLVDSAIAKDIPVVTGLALCATLFVLVVNLLIDIAYSWVNPRLRTD
jgi:peptide/nickel transport system permease protein